MNATLLRLMFCTQVEQATTLKKGLAEMSSYIVIDTEVLDEDAFAEFAPKIRDAVTANGGEFIVRGGDSEVVEGDWSPQRLVIMAFATNEGAGEFIHSADYQALQELRSRALKSNVLVVEGYDG